MKKIWWCLWIIVLVQIVCGVYQPEQVLLDDVALAKQQYKQSPFSAESRFELAMALSYTGQIEDAWAIFQTILDYDPDYAATVLNKYERLKSQEPQNWKHHFKLGFAYYFNKRKQESFVAFDEVIRLKPNMVWAYGFQGLLLGDQKKYKEAIDVCKQAFKIEPDATAIHFLIAEGYYRRGDYWNAFIHVMRVGQLKTVEKKQKVYEGYMLDQEILDTLNIVPEKTTKKKDESTPSADSKLNDNLTVPDLSSQGVVSPNNGDVSKVKQPSSNVLKDKDGQ